MLLTELFESDTVAEEFTILGAGIYILYTRSHDRVGGNGV